MSEVVIEYGELEDGLGWIVEAPFRAGVEQASGQTFLQTSAVDLGVDLASLDEFTKMGFLRVLSGDYGLETRLIEELYGDRQRELCILLGIASALGKCPGP